MVKSREPFWLPGFLTVILIEFLANNVLSSDQGYRKDTNVFLREVGL